MFTGIIEDLGKIIDISNKYVLVSTKLTDINMGDSISINGVCLTLNNIQNKINNEKILKFYFSPETFQNTNFNQVRHGDIVNIERALKIGSRLGGHILTGHIETIGTIKEIINTQNSYLFKFEFPDSLKRYLVKKGSIGIDGISLTIVDITGNIFSCAIIPYTFYNTNLQYKKIGDSINLEPDIIAKYIENLIKNNDNGITLEKIKDYGFF